MARTRKVTLKDIARETGYSVNTVSHALNDKPDISDSTKQLIKAAAERLGYIGNALASSLRSGVSRVVAIIVGDISNPHFAIMVKEAEMYLKGMGYLSFVLNTNEDPALEKQAILAALNKNVDGIIICPAPEAEENIRFLQRVNIPFVLIGRRLRDIDGSYVICDDVNGGYVAATHLLAQGHRDILFLNGPESVSSARERLAGYRQALTEHRLPYREDLIVRVPITLEKSSGTVANVLANRHDFTAVIAFSDMIAWEVISLLNQAQRRVPQDISVVGFDDIQSRFLFPVMLTSVNASKVTMAQKAAEILLQAMQNPDQESTQLILPTRLILRKSTTSYPLS